MAFQGWFTYGGVEIINNTRAVANTVNAGFSEAALCDPCPELWKVLEDLDYRGTRNDPWADTSIPQSADFYGFQGMELGGFDKSTLTARAQARIGDGAAISGTFRDRREVTIRAVATAGSEVALTYGLAWLASVFRGPGGFTCDGEALCFYTACPDCTGLTPDQCHDQYLRQLFNVAVLDAPAVTQRGKMSCGAYFAEVTMTLVAGTPYFYTAPKLVIDSGDWNNLGESSGYPISCASFDECDLIFTCPPSNDVPVRPALTDPCADIRPTAGDYRFREVVAGFEDAVSSDWFEKVPIVVYETPVSTAEANLVVSFIPKFVDEDCSFNTVPKDKCNSCLTFHVPIIPVNGQVTVDGRTETVTIRCEQTGAVLYTTDSPIYGMNFDTGFPNGVFNWNALECGFAYCVLVESYRNYETPPNVKVYLSERRDVA